MMDFKVQWVYDWQLEASKEDVPDTVGYEYGTPVVRLAEVEKLIAALEWAMKIVEATTCVACEHERAQAFLASIAAWRKGQRNCPTCDSPQPHLHPAMQHGGEVQPCTDPWHGRTGQEGKS